MLRALSLLLLWLNLGHATSVLENYEIPEPYTVDDISILTNGDNITVEIRLDPSVDLASNLRRRQWVSDPIGAEALRKAAVKESLLNDGQELFAFLVHNSTVEDASELLFRLELMPRSELEQPPVLLSGPGASQLASTPAPKAYVGKAYRRVTPIWPPTAALEWREVGSASATIDGEDALAQFEVDDEEALGIPSATYKLATRYLQPAMRSLSPRFAAEQPLLWCDKTFRHLTGPLSQFTFLRAKSRAFRRWHSKRSDTTDSDAHGGSLYGSIGRTTGCPSQKRIAVVGAALDCNFLAAFNSTANARLHVMDSYTTASPWLESAFNVALGLGELYVPLCTNNGYSTNASDTWDYSCSGTNDTALTDRLSSFSTWRSKRAGDNMAGWTLWTSCASSSVVGLSQTGALCNQNAGCSLVKQTGANDAKVLAHELGHTFGAVHDCTAETCSSGADSTGGCCPLSSSTCNANAAYLMNPAISNSTSFSPCTIGQVCSLMGSGYTNTTCLRGSDAKLTLVTPNVCGNGIVEEGEECDCGGVEGCGNNTCCDPTTCRFTSGSVCDDSNSACCSNCQLSARGTVCSNSTSACVSPATCDGSSAACPAPQKVADGTACNSSDSGLRCYSGKCTSRDQQCVNMVSGTAYDRYGNVLTISGACGDECTLACQASSAFGSNCYVFYGRSFIDGTPCGSNGYCTSGFCSAATSGGSGSSFNRLYLLCIIAVPVAVALLVALCSCSRSRQKSSAAAVARARGQSGWVPNMAANPAATIAPPPLYRAPPPPPPPPWSPPSYPLAAQSPPASNARVYQRPPYAPPAAEGPAMSPAPELPERPVNSYQISPHGFPGR